MSYSVYMVSYLGAGGNHQAIFVETASDESGQLFHVIGNIQRGMDYETKIAKKPETSVTFVEKELLGTTIIANYSRFDAICQKIPPAAKQYNGAKRINPQVPLRRCTEWAWEAVQALKDEGILQ